MDHEWPALASIPLSPTEIEVKLVRLFDSPLLLGALTFLVFSFFHFFFVFGMNFSQKFIRAIKVYEMLMECLVFGHFNIISS